MKKNVSKSLDNNFLLKNISIAFSVAISVVLAGSYANNAYAQSAPTVIPPSVIPQVTPSLNNNFEAKGKGSAAPNIPSMLDKSRITSGAQGMPSTAGSAETTPGGAPSVATKTGSLGGGSDTLYTWKDAKGAIHVTNTPPPDIIINNEIQRPQVIRVDRPVSTDTRNLSSQEQLAAFEKEKAEKEKAEKEAGAEKAKNAIQCDQIKSRMNLYQSDKKILIPGGVAVDDASRAKTLQTLKDGYASLCQ